MSSKYSKFPLTSERVPTQFGGMSKRPRDCRKLGWIGSLRNEPYRFEEFFRIEDGEIGQGRIFYTRRWKGDERGNIDPAGPIYHYPRYILFKELPEEIKKRIEAKQLPPESDD